MPRKSKKIRKITTPPGGIRFDIEENAEQLLHDAIDSMPTTIDKDEGGELHHELKKPPRPKAGVHQIDLHGLTLGESQQRIDALLRRVVTNKQPVRVKIITGKGKHRQRGVNLLARDVHRWLTQKYHDWIVEIEQSPHDVRLGDLPLRGHFEVVLKRN